ncbi:MAG: hypothetical protein ACOYM3_24990 [Terrimicrobiaceae bacterium]
MLALIPSFPFIIYAAYGGTAGLLRGDFSYWPIRNSVVTVLDLLLLLSFVGYLLMCFGFAFERHTRMTLWALSAAVYILFPASHLLDPRPVSLPAPIAFGLFLYMLILSALSVFAFCLAYADRKTKDA